MDVELGQLGPDVPKESYKPPITFLSYLKIFFKNPSLLWKAEPASIVEVKSELQIDEHKIGLDKLLFKYQSSVEKGLDKETVLKRQALDGENSITPPKKIPEWKRFMNVIFSWFSLLLLIGGLISLIAYAMTPKEPSFDNPKVLVRDPSNLYIGIALIFVVLISAVFTYYNERQPSDLMESLRSILPKKAKVLRSSKYDSVNVKDLVSGDVVLLEKGDSVPADLRIVESQHLKVDNSAITGEVEALSRSAEYSHENPLETKNLLFSGTFVVDGSCTGIVIKTGDSTVMGKIVKLVNATTKLETTLSVEMKHFVRQMGILSCIFGLICFILALTINNQSFVSALVVFIGIVVANIPEGSLATITVALTSTAKKLADRGVFVKNLDSIETLGSTSVFCSSKTGVLTMNEFCMNSIWINQQVIDNPKTISDSLIINDLLRNISICNKQHMEVKEDKQDNQPAESETHKMIGDTIETALLKFCSIYLDNQKIQEFYPVITEIPFSSTSKFKVTIHEQPDLDNLLMVMQGAPEVILEKCLFYLHNKELKPITADFRLEYQEICKKFASEGDKVIAICQLQMADKYQKSFKFDFEDYNFEMAGMCFVGLMGLVDPLRSLVPESVSKLREAGIKVMMVTGDHPLTATAVARKAGIVTCNKICEFSQDSLVAQEPNSEKEPSPSDADTAVLEEKESLISPKTESSDILIIKKDSKKALLINGSEISSFTSSDWKKILDYDEIVFARISAQQKYKIVEQTQLLGHVVAFSGDGVHDAPALKKADVGIAMGMSGSNVSKDSSNIILLNDDFSCILLGIREGRRMFDNLKKSIAYVLTSNMPELVPFMMTIILKIPLALSTILVLCVDLGTDLYPAISLAHELSERDLMTRAPRNVYSNRLVNYKLLVFSYLQIGIIHSIACFLVFFRVMSFHGFPFLKLINSYSQFYDKKAIFLKTTFEYRMEVLEKAQSAYFLCLVICQFANLLICKSRKYSLFNRSFFKNWNMLVAMLTTAILASILVYVPKMDAIIGTSPVPLSLLWVAFPAILVIILYDEIRKLIIRNNPTGLFSRVVGY